MADESDPTQPRASSSPRASPAPAPNVTRRTVLGAASLPLPRTTLPASPRVPSSSQRDFDVGLTTAGGDAELVSLCDTVGERERQAELDPDAFDAALQRIANRTATTLAGIRAKAKLLLLLSPAAGIPDAALETAGFEDDRSNDLAPDEQLLDSLLRDILALVADDARR